MMLNGKITYRKAIVLTPERIYELESLLKKHCETITYEATTVSGVEIAFENVEELICYENFEKKRIKHLTVIGYKRYSRVFRISFEYSLWWFKTRGYDETCTCSYTLNSTDSESVFSSDIKIFLKKCTAKYWMWGKLSLFGIVGFYCCLQTSYMYFAGALRNLTIWARDAFLAIPIAILLIAGTGAFYRFVIRNVFPPIAYKWGEEKKRQERMDTIRNNLLWTIVVGVVVGVFVEILNKTLFG